jgi:hypothetical protein
MLIAAFIILVLGLISYVALILFGLRLRRVDIWWRDYLRHLRERAQTVASSSTTHVMFCFVDHFEPRWNKPGYATEFERVKRWSVQYPKLSAGHRDADGKAPQHTFFYPSEEYEPEHLDVLANLCARGYGEIEIHLHHDRDTEAGLRANLGEFLNRLVTSHDALPLDGVTGKPMWSFIHGNWALDNSREDGRWCGVNNELQVLKDMGCYADFTLPSAPSDTQTSTVNSIYYATDEPHMPKSHNKGVRVYAGGKPVGDLMIIQGPLTFLWKLKGIVPIPGIESGDIRTSSPPTKARVDAWVKTGIHVKGKPDWIFVKVHTHGAQERDMDTLLGVPAGEMFSYLEREYNDGDKYALHYVTAREMYNIVRAAEAGMAGGPGEYRDFVVPRPGYKFSNVDAG